MKIIKIKIFLYWDKIKLFLFVPIFVISFVWIFSHCDKGDLDFILADLRDTIPVYNAYLNKYSDPKHKYVINKRLEELYFLNARKIGTVESYNVFLKTNPSEHLAQKARFERDCLLPFRENFPKKPDSNSNWYFEKLHKYEYNQRSQ